MTFARLLHLSLLLIPVSAAAHDMEVAVSQAPPLVLLRATYGGSTPVEFGAVQIYSPAAPNQEFQTGRTDRQGRFSFQPDVAGSWRVIVDDEEGHKQQVEVTVPKDFANSTPVAPPTGAPRWERALLGVSVLLAITGFWYGRQARRQLTSQS